MLITLEGALRRRDDYRQKWEDTEQNIEIKNQKISAQQTQINQLSKDLAFARNQLEEQSQTNSHYHSAIFHQNTELTKLKQQLSELEQVSNTYYQASQAEIKQWKNEAETHLEALKLTETQNLNYEN